MSHDDDGGGGGLGAIGFILILLVVNACSYLFGWGFWVY